jgi:cytochrome c oxidase subunit II
MNHPLLVQALFALLQINGAGLPERPIANIFKPMASPAAAEKHIAYFVFAITAVIFVVVGGLIVYTIMRFRRKPGDDTQQEPPLVYGSNQIEVAWTVIPILIVFILIGVTARVIAAVENQSPPKQMVKVRVIGHQWWWQVEYPDYGVISANEVHMPVSTDRSNATYLELESMDVIHSFWVPQLAGKTDLIPNRINYIWMDPQEPGIYLGNCAEYCGTQHANMLLRVIAQPQEEFRQWITSQQHVPSPTAQAAADGKTVYESLSCVNCHTIKGTTSAGKFGPDLTHLMNRQTIGSGVVTNTPEHLRAWVKDPQEVKPGALMPSFNLTSKQLDQVLAYLESLN